MIAIPAYDWIFHHTDTHSVSALCCDILRSDLLRFSFSCDNTPKVPGFGFYVSMMNNGLFRYLTLEFDIMS